MNSKKNNSQQSQSFVNHVIDWSSKNQLFVILLTLSLVAFGLISIYKMPLDAIPDLSDTQVIIRTDFPGQSPQVIEDQVTYPLASQMLGLPNTKVVRGYSMFGTSFIYIIFKDSVDLYWARSRVLESLSQVQGSLPKGIIPQLGPDATGVGWVYQYALVDMTGKRDLSQLRTLQDWFLKYELMSVDGVSEIASVGGFVKEYQIMVDPNRLRAFNIPLSKVTQLVRESNAEVGGRTLEMGESEYLITSKGYVTDIKDLEKVVIGHRDGIPVFLSDIARVQEGPALRRGLTEYNGEGEAVGGIIIMRPSSNALSVIKDVKQKIEDIKKGLPEGVDIVTVYDRSEHIYGSIKYLMHKLLEEALIVAFVCFIFLLHIRSALVAIITIPLGIMGAFIIMFFQGISANIMSLGGIAIAIGAMVDASIVMVENANRKLATLSARELQEQRSVILINSVKEVGPSLFFSLLIIAASFLPVFALTGQSEKLFTPLAYTKTYAMACAAILSIVLVPVLMLWLVKGKFKSEDENILNRFFKSIYKPVLRKVLTIPKVTLLILVLLSSLVYIPISKIGHEFMPPLYEGSLLYMPVTVPGATATQMRQILQVTDKMITELPEVERVFGKAGRADTATDPAPLSMIETWITLKPKGQWRPGMTPSKLMDEINQKIKIPGIVNSVGYPIKTRLDMLSTGIRTPIGIKVAGGDLKIINTISQEIENLVRDIPGTSSVFADRVQGGKYIEIEPNRKLLAKYGIELVKFQNIIQVALGGERVSEVIEGRERYNIIVRYDREFRQSIDDIKNILVTDMHGAKITLAEIAEVKITQGPPMIKSENARLNGWIFIDIHDQDIGSYITNTKIILDQKLKLPSGYSLSFSGQFEQMQEANKRLAIAIPATILIIFTLLYIHFGRWDRTLIIMLSIPFSLIGGIWALYIADYNFSIAVAVGFIALSGVAVETAIVMLIYIDQQMRDFPRKDLSGAIKNIIDGAVLRLRPKLMTVSVIVLGLLPVFFTDGPGSDVMRRIALPMVGGMISTTILVLIAIPIIYLLFLTKENKS
jgi:Cu(I)/Ag(I) efflux system membrane protein CusA/SilA